MKVFARLKEDGQKKRAFHVLTVNTLQEARDAARVIRGRGGVYVGRLGRRTDKVSASFFTTQDDELAIELLIDLDEARSNPKANGNG